MDLVLDWLVGWLRNKTMAYAHRVAFLHRLYFSPALGLNELYPEESPTKKRSRVMKHLTAITRT